jgi:hypothetical protein
MPQPRTNAGCRWGTASGTMLGESSLSALIYHRTIFKKGAFVDETDRQAKGPTAGPS